MKMHNVAYRRVSSADQNTDRQLIKVDVEFDAEFTDKVSGKDQNRPELQNMLSRITTGDIVHVHSIDRLARNLKDLLELIEEINGKGASIKFHKDGLFFHYDEKQDPFKSLQLAIMGAVAAFERSMINERCAEGRAIAKAKGKRFGRKPVLSKAQKKEVVDLYLSGKKITALAIDFDVSRPAIYRVLEAAGLHTKRPGIESVNTQSIQ